MEILSSCTSGIKSFRDSQCALNVARSEGSNPRSKNVSATFHFVSNGVSRSDLRLEY